MIRLLERLNVPLLTLRSRTRHLRVYVPPHYSKRVDVADIIYLFHFDYDETGRHISPEWLFRGQVVHISSRPFSALRFPLKGYHPCLYDSATFLSALSDCYGQYDYSHLCVLDLVRA